MGQKSLAIDASVAAYPGQKFSIEFLTDNGWLRSLLFPGVYSYEQAQELTCTRKLPVLLAPCEEEGHWLDSRRYSWRLIAQVIDTSIAAYPVSVTSSSSSATSGGFTGPAGNVCSCARCQTAELRCLQDARREGKSLEQQVIDASVRARKNNNNPWY
jgi:hypothetical protein